jgi:hypothetical protein
MPEQNDWRLHGQERYLMDVQLHKATWKTPSPKWDHDHCEFCFAKFSEQDGDLHEGYSTEGGKNWVCEQCFQDFKEMFRFVVE